MALDERWQEDTINPVLLLGFSHLSPVGTVLPTIALPEKESQAWAKNIGEFSNLEQAEG
jgi:hypothetical protein